MTCFVRAIFGINHLRDFLKFEIAFVLLTEFQIFKNTLEQLIPNRPPKHVITSTNN